MQEVQNKLFQDFSGNFQEEGGQMLILKTGYFNAICIL